jgi:copper(I)-binding protein
MLADPVHIAPAKSAAKAASSLFRRAALILYPRAIIVGPYDNRLAYCAASVVRGIGSMKRAAAFLARMFAVLAVAYGSLAQSPRLTVQDAWTRQVPGSDVAAVYLTVRNPTSKPITIVGVESPAASHAMIHETQTNGGQSQMRPHEQLVVPAGKAVQLAPGGLHIMLHGMKQSAAVGETVALVLLLADGGKVPFAAPVRPLTAP